MQLNFENKLFEVNKILRTWNKRSLNAKLGLRSTLITILHLKNVLKGHFFKFKVPNFEFPANTTVVNLGELSPKKQDFNC